MKKLNFWLAFLILGSVIIIFTQVSSQAQLSIDCFADPSRLLNWWPNKGDASDTVNEVGPMTEASLLNLVVEEVIDLGTLPGKTESHALDINDRGQVVGISYNWKEPEEAFLWTEKDGMISLGTLGGDQSWANGINNAGQVVGSSKTSGGETHAFLWTASTGMQDLGTLGDPYSHSNASDINDQGQIAGNSISLSGAMHACLWTKKDDMIDLGDLGGGRSYANAINNQGQIIGYSRTSDWDWHAFLWTLQEGMIDLGTLPDFPEYSYRAFGINDRGQIVGRALNTDIDEVHAFLWTDQDGVMEVILYDAQAFDINNRGEIVGEYSVGPYDRNGFIWIKKIGMILLPTLGGPEVCAYAINEAGEIVGVSRVLPIHHQRATLWRLK